MISVTEIVLIIAGILAIILGYLIPNGHDAGEGDIELTEQKINEMVRKAVQNSQGQIDDLLDECMEDAINKAERAMDRVTNEKMSAISEYSDTVMNDIHKNHDEVMFMYDMLNDKHKNLRNTVSEVTRAAKEVKQTAEEAAITAEHAEATVRNAKEAAMKVKTKATYEESIIATDAPAQSKQVITPKIQTEPEFEYYDEDYTDEEEFKPIYKDENQPEKIDNKDIVSDDESNKFSSLTDILDRADAAAAEKTSNKVIGYEQEQIDPEHKAETIKTETKFEEQPVVEKEYNETVLPKASDSRETAQAKVVSISDASRKKISEKEVNTEQVYAANEAAQMDDPVSRNQRILDMHKQGKSAVVIARELRLGIGEVKLVIDLAGKHKKNRSSIM